MASQIIWQYIVIVAEYYCILLVALWSRVLKSPYSHASMRFSVCVQIDVPKQWTHTSTPGCLPSRSHSRCARINKLGCPGSLCMCVCVCVCTPMGGHFLKRRSGWGWWLGGWKDRRPAKGRIFNLVSRRRERSCTYIYTCVALPLAAQNGRRAYILRLKTHTHTRIQGGMFLVLFSSFFSLLFW